MKLLHTSALCVTVALGGCAFTDPYPGFDQGWRRATVVQTGTRAEMPDYALRRCEIGQDGPPAMAEQWAWVRTRRHGLAYQWAVPLGAGQTYAAQQRVLLNPADCRLGLRPLAPATTDTGTHAALSP